MTHKLQHAHMLPLPKAGVEGVVVGTLAVVAAVVLGGAAARVLVAVAAAVVVVVGGAAAVLVVLVVEVAGVTLVPAEVVPLPHGEFPQMPMEQIQLHGLIVPARDGKVQPKKRLLVGLCKVKYIVYIYT